VALRQAAEALLCFPLEGFAAAFCVFRRFFHAWRIFIRLRWCLLRLRAISLVLLAVGLEKDGRPLEGGRLLYQRAVP